MINYASGNPIHDDIELFMGNRENYSAFKQVWCKKRSHGAALSDKA